MGLFDRDRTCITTCGEDQPPRMGLPGGTHTEALGDVQRDLGGPGGAAAEEDFTRAQPMDVPMCLTSPIRPAGLFVAVLLPSCGLGT